MTFVEATCWYRSSATDPRDPSGERSEKRLINLDDVRLITPSADATPRTIFHLRSPSNPPYLIVLEPYAYWVAILTTDQPRPA